MHLICDFDDTLTNTTKYWNFWLDKLESVGIDRKKAEDVGARLFVEYFTLPKHMSELGVETELANRLFQEIQEHVKEFGISYTFPDVFPFLSSNKEKHSFSLLTYGEEGNQKWRLNQSGIGLYFSSLRFAGPTKHKVEHIKEMINSGVTELLFVDDSPNELNPVVDEGLPVKLYRIVRPGAKHDYIHEKDNVAWTRISALNEIVF